MRGWRVTSLVSMYLVCEPLLVRFGWLVVGAEEPFDALVVDGVPAK